jgi:predicted permease
VRALPGVESVAWIDRMPLLGSGNTGTPSVVGRPAAASNDPAAELRNVGTTYFQALGVPLIAGRGFASSDGPGSKRVVIVNRAFVQALFPGEDPLGRALTFVFIDGQPPLEIVGVVGDEKVDGLDRPASPVLYFPYAQDPSLGMSLMVRASGDPHALGRPIRDLARRLDPGILIASERTMDEIISASPAAAVRGYPALLLSAFAVLALLLASIGLYGVSALAVAARVQEFGVRMALGATRASLLRLVLRRGMALAGLGLSLGLLVALAGTQALRAVLFGIQPWDRATLAGTSLLLGVCALLACLVPAWRAARLSPLAAQRSGER